MIQPIYLDYNGTTPHDPAVIEAMRPFLENEFGNPSSSHWFGITPKKAVDKARQQVADLLNCAPGEIIFTSGGTESNNHAIKGIAGNLFHKGNHIITTQIEHPAVLEVCRFLDGHGYHTTYLPVDETGRVKVEDVEKAIGPETILLSIMHANNEVGTIQPIEDIAALAKANGIVLHSDAAQSVGKIPTDVNSLGVDLLSVAGHKVYAPKGVGALYIRKDLEPAVFCHGAEQESGRRGGTENVMGIVGLGKACETANQDPTGNTRHLRTLRDRLEAGLKRSLPGITTNGHPENRLPNTLSIAFPGLAANRILEALGLEVAASAGAACHSDRINISHVLEAMQVPEELAKGTLRFSTGRMTTAADIDLALAAIVKAVNAVQKDNGA